METTTWNDAETRSLGERLAAAAFPYKPVFLRVSGSLGTGKSTFARGFIQAWLRLSGEQPAESLVSPTYNIARVYGLRFKLAHLDLYRVKNMRELEQLGFEHYFFEHDCCLVEWLEHVPEALAAMPTNAIEVDLEFGRTPIERKIRVRSPKEISLEP